MDSVFIKTIMKKQDRPHKLKGVTGAQNGFRSLGNVSHVAHSYVCRDSEKGKEARRASD